MKKAIFILLAFCLLPACVTSSDFDRLRGEVNDLRRDSADMRKDVDGLKEKTASSVREDSFAAVRESQMTNTARVNDLSSGLQELRGRYEENRYFLEKTLKEQASEKELLKAQIAGLETQVKEMRQKLAAMEAQARPPQESEPQKQTSPAEPAAKEPAAAAAVKSETADSAKESYEAAYGLYQQKKYKEAREKLERFIKEHPQSDLAGNAQFWIAESHYAEKDHENAILAYETLLKKYPDNPKIAGAMLKQAYSFIEIGDAKTGRILLTRVAEKYPHSKEAEAAKKRLAELDKKPARKK